MNKTPEKGNKDVNLLSPLRENSWENIGKAEKDSLESNKEEKEKNCDRIPVVIEELEETLTLLGRDSSSDSQLLKWKQTLITVQNSLQETKDLRKNLYIANQKSILTPGKESASDELETLIKYVVSSTRTQQLELERALADG